MHACMRLQHMLDELVLNNVIERTMHGMRERGWESDCNMGQLANTHNQTRCIDAGDVTTALKCYCTYRDPHKEPAALARTLHQSPMLQCEPLQLPPAQQENPPNGALHTYAACACCSFAAMLASLSYSPLESNLRMVASVGCGKFSNSGSDFAMSKPPLWFAMSQYGWPNSWMQSLSRCIFVMELLNAATRPMLPWYAWKNGKTCKHGCNLLGCR